ncbi:sterol desaturase family protein [Thioclava sp. JE_KL1]|uniref:sterol desaturase family protein n=1 Tax=Thioclava sp. JE_KL1 TaxID=2651187 RepID=UPI00128CFCE8|nr:sterol desaturase family protein [Thioclava sp. JE_KL1]MPQ95035.1 sterol desaturase family protein [Thioclava sp. JE_KL1]
MRMRLMLSHLSIWVMIAVVAAAAYWTAQGPWWLWAVALLGIPAQMLNEYGLHRYIFHMAPPKRQWAFNWLYRVHYGHHEFPTCWPLLFAPLSVIVPVLVGNTALLWAVLSLIGVPYAFDIAVAVVPLGGAATFLAYEWFHTTAHVTVKKTAIERHVSTLHNQHHFRDFSKWFHVTAGGEVIDRLMGTAISRDQLKTQSRVEFIRTLGLRPDDPRLIAAREKFAPRFGITEAEVSRAGHVGGGAAPAR